MKILFRVNVALRFLLEILNIVLLVGIAFHYSTSSAELVIRGILVPLLFIGIWAMFISPKARVKIDDTTKFWIEAILFFYIFESIKNVSGFWSSLYLSISILNSIIIRIGERKGIL